MLLILLLAVPTLHAQTRVWSTNLLGAGGSNFSGKSDRAVIGNNGLRTGQYTGEHHLIGAYAEGDWSSYLTTMPYVQGMPLGYGGSAGLIYEYQINHFLLQTGLGVRAHRVWANMADTVLWRYDVPDSWSGKDGVVCDSLEYQFYYRRDMSEMLYAQVPLLFGQQLVGLWGKGYYMVGFKLNYALRGQTRVQAQGSTIAHYDRYIGNFYEMDNHGWRRDVPVDVASDRLALKLDVLGHVEAGYEWGVYSPNRGWRGMRGVRPLDLRFRLAAFAEMSLMSVAPTTGYDMVKVPNDGIYDFERYQFHHAFSSTEMMGRSLRSLNAGVKLTVLVGVKAKQKCVICGHYKTERDMANPYRKGL